ncbi:wall-associated receptor kinase-like 8 [Gossypium australe]|uniref:Wall-associated receptor kinase-like 8 n=1 Tax=Gossypium australe TaxID=47621 RepID=A0A5B6UFI8_9ROSI|nr:wall-associated receptor kinase-like 8 [Gossypium australe]
MHLADFAIYFLFADPAGCNRPGLGLINFNIYKVEKCGNVSFHYPFSKENHDNSNDWFKVICIKKDVPFLNINGMNLQLLNFDFWSGTVTVNHPISYSNCRKNHHNGMSLNLTGTRFYYSDFRNSFWSSGCGNLVTIFGNGTNNLIGGFLQPSCRINNKTSSIVSCPLIIPMGLSSFFANMSNMVDSSDYRRKRSCEFVSLISNDHYSYIDDFDIRKRTHVPMQLQWSTPISGECYLNYSSKTSCISNGDQYCWSMLSSIHLCVCYKDTSDTSYLRSCKGGKCDIYKYCNILCLNTPSNYCSPKSCPPHYEYNNTGFLCQRKIQAQNAPNLRSIIVGT